MANIVELREMSDDKLLELVENAREEMFNLRFQKATAQLDNHARMKIVRREIAQLETVLRMRELAIELVAAEPEVADALAGKDWSANAYFDYEASSWQVKFSDADNKEIVTGQVDLNKKQRRNRRDRDTKGQSQPVLGYEVVG